MCITYRLLLFCCNDNHLSVTTVDGGVPGLFVPKTFRSQERVVPIGNVRSRDFSFPGNESSLELSFSGPFVLPGRFVPRNFRSQDFSFPGTFVPPTILQGISYERRHL